MSTQTEPRVDDDLEETWLWEQDIPCGGVGVRHNIPCPHEKPAVAHRVSGCPCPAPSRYKCLDCYVKWATQPAAPRDIWVCFMCGQRHPGRPRYAPI